jgi:hypothetical protein
VYVAGRVVKLMLCGDAKGLSSDTIQVLASPLLICGFGDII